MKELVGRLILRHLVRREPSTGPSLRSQRGQAVTEYLLVIVVVVGIALGVLYQLNTAFKKYVQSYFGDYIACLLETGEMPSLGGGDGANAGTCSAAFEPFSMKNGRPLASGDSGSDTGSRGGGRKFSRSANRGGNSSRVNKRNAAMNGERNNNSGVVAGSTSGGTGKKSVRGGGNISSGSFRFKTARMRGDNQIRIDSRFVFSRDKEGSKDSSIVKEVEGKNSGSRAARKLAVNMELFKPKEAPPEVSLDLSAGDYLRYILIFAILIGIFVFFGGQLNQLRKSWEKS